MTIAGLQDQPTIELARKAKLQVDALFKDVVSKDFDAVVMPGGQPGSDNLAAVSLFDPVRMFLSFSDHKIKSNLARFFEFFRGTQIFHTFHN